MKNKLMLILLSIAGAILCACEVPLIISLLHADGIECCIIVVAMLIVAWGVMLLGNESDKYRNQKQITMKKVTIENDDNGKVTVEGTGATVEQKDGSVIIKLPEPEPEKPMLRTWEEIMDKKAGTKMYLLGNAGDVESDSVLVRTFRKANVNTERQAEKLRAIAQLMVIADYYNEMPGEEMWVEPYWLNDYNKLYTIRLDAASSCTPRFKNAELLMEAYEHNRSIFETALKP